ncbi:MAG: PIN domain-containing protein [Spirochaetes bacterium]|nr:PIN domain-containing protein [Spirochaetota bacterium]
MTQTDNRRLLLDTHIFLWLMNGDPRLSDPTIQGRIEDAAEHTELLLSAASIWEIARLARAGRIRSSLPIATWTERALETPGLVVTPVEPDLALEAGSLPGEPPADIADQMLVATARARDAALVTADPALIDYAAGGYLRVMEVGR